MNNGNLLGLWGRGDKELKSREQGGGASPDIRLLAPQTVLNGDERGDGEGV